MLTAGKTAMDSAVCGEKSMILHFGGLWVHCFTEAAMEVALTKLLALTPSPAGLAGADWYDMVAEDELNALAALYDNGGNDDSSNSLASAAESVDTVHGDVDQDFVDKPNVASEGGNWDSSCTPAGSYAGFENKWGNDVSSEIFDVDALSTSAQPHTLDEGGNGDYLCLSAGSHAGFETKWGNDVSTDISYAHDVLTSAEPHPFDAVSICRGGDTDLNCLKDSSSGNCNNRDGKTRYGRRNAASRGGKYSFDGKPHDKPVAANGGGMSKAKHTDDVSPGSCAAGDTVAIKKAEQAMLDAMANLCRNQTKLNVERLHAEIKLAKPLMAVRKY